MSNNKKLGNRAEAGRAHSNGPDVFSLGGADYVLVRCIADGDDKGLNDAALREGGTVCVSCLRPMATHRILLLAMRTEQQPSGKTAYGLYTPFLQCVQTQLNRNISRITDNEAGMADRCDLPPTLFDWLGASRQAIGLLGTFAHANHIRLCMIRINFFDCRLWFTSYTIPPDRTRTAAP